MAVGGRTGAEGLGGHGPENHRLAIPPAPLQQRLLLLRLPTRPHPALPLLLLRPRGFRRGHGEEDITRAVLGRAVRQRLDTVLRSQCDPEAVNAGAFADQAARIAANGGRAEIAASADIPFTPAPA